jgi:hypothetical protein
MPLVDIWCPILRRWVLDVSLLSSHLLMPHE